MRRELRQYFIHHRAERRGTVALLFICVVVVGLSIVLPRLYAPEPPDPSTVVALEQAITKARGSASLSLTSQNAEKDPPKLSTFNPNTLSDSGYAAMGFTEKEISMLRKYMAAGGHFKVKDDFGRLFFMDEARMDSVRPFLDLPDQLPQKSTARTGSNARQLNWSDTARYDYYSYNPIVADLNNSDTNELKKLPGIGSWYAKKIIAYREELGGYVDLGQLLELWKMTPDKVDRLADRVSIDPSVVETIPINVATTQRLSSHPYITFAAANRIVTYREENGPFESIDDLVGAGLLNEELRLKLAPYLNFQ